MFVQPTGAPLVCRALGMLTAVEFDDQMPFPADEIGDIGTERDLPGKLVAVQLPVAKIAPETKFGLGFVLSQ